MLAWSVLQAHAQSKYDVDLLAIVHPNVTKMRPVLTAIGFKVIERPVPLLLSEIKNPLYRDKAPKSGCCGLGELIKLEGLTLVGMTPFLLVWSAKAMVLPMLFVWMHVRLGKGGLLFVVIVDWSVSMSR